MQSSSATTSVTPPSRYGHTSSSSSSPLGAGGTTSGSSSHSHQQQQHSTYSSAGQHSSSQHSTTTGAAAGTSSHSHSHNTHGLHGGSARVLNRSGGSHNSLDSHPSASPVEMGMSPVQMSTLLNLGDHFTVQASAATLRGHLTDAYWDHAMETVCDGKLVGVAVRYTGDGLVLVQFKPPTLSRNGRSYPMSLTIPQQYLVPMGTRRLGSKFELSPLSPLTTEPTPPMSGSNTANGPFPPGTPVPHLCVVCGRWDQPGVIRQHGYKCTNCIGKTSLQRLRDEAARLQEDKLSDPKFMKEIPSAFSTPSTTVTPTTQHPPGGGTST